MKTCQRSDLSGIISSLVRASQLEPGCWEFNVETQLPLSAGLGSSASLAVAAAACIIVNFTQKAQNQPFDLNAINSLALKAEEVVHGRPSGIDNTVITYGGLLAYKDKSIRHIEE